MSHRGEVLGPHLPPESGWRTRCWRIGAVAAGVCLGSVLYASAVSAQQEEPTRLTLEDALALAQRNNPAYRRVVVQADASGANVTAGFGAMLPDLQASFGFTGQSRTVFTGTDDFGRSVELDQASTFKSSSSSQSLSSNITLFDGFSNLNNLRGARAGVTAADAGVDAESARLEAEIKRRFYQVLRSQQLIAIEQDLLDVRQRDLDATDRLFRVAARTQVDVLGAQVEVSRQEQALDAARGSALTNQLLLSEWIGLESSDQFEAVGTLPDVFDPSDLDADALVSRVLGNNPRIRQAMAQAAQASFSATAAHGSRWPTVSANAGFGRSLQDQGYGGMFKFNPRDRGFNFGVNVRVPVFNRFQTNQAIAQADANRDAAEEDLRAARLELATMVRSNMIDVQNSYRSVLLADRSAELTRQRLSMAREEYQLGSIDYTQLQSVVTQSAAAERDALSARGRWATSLVALEEIVGMPVRP
jgi:outer membrane protein